MTCGGVVGLSGRLGTISHLGELLDGDAAVSEHSLPTVDEADARGARDRVHVTGVVQPQWISVPTGANLRGSFVAEFRGLGLEPGGDDWTLADGGA